VDVDRGEAGAGERRGHLDLAVDALFAEDGDGGRSARSDRLNANGGRSGVKVTTGVMPGLVPVEAQLVLLSAAGGLSRRDGDAVGDIGPDRAEGEKVFVEEHLRAARNAEGVRGSACRARHAGFEAVLAEATRLTSSRSAARTWITAPSSSLKSAAKDCRGPAGIVRSTPVWPAKAISTAVASRPPSERSW
jgi:hypothetical protein